MIKEVEAEKDGNIMRGHIEVTPNVVFMGCPRTYTITPYIEDKVFGAIEKEVFDKDVTKCVSIIEKRIKAEMKDRLESGDSIEDVLRKKGFE